MCPPSSAALNGRDRPCATGMTDWKSVLRIDAVAVAERTRPALVAAETAPVEREKVFDRQLCCEVWADNGEPVTPQVFVEGLGWVTPPSDEVVDHQAELAATGWKFAKSQINDTAKGAMRNEIKDIAHRGSLNGSAQTAQMPAWLAILPSRQQTSTI